MENPRVRDEIRAIMGFWLAARRRRLPASTRFRSSSRGRRARRKRDRPLRVPDASCASFLQWRVGDAVLLGEANVLPQESQQYFARRRRAAHDVQLLGQPASLLRARLRRRAPARARRSAQTPAIPATRAVGALPAQPRRARPRPAERRAARAGLRAVRARAADAALRPRHPAAARADARGDRAPARARVQPACSRCPGTPVLRYGDEIGMGDDLRAEGARRRADADAVVERAERRLLDRREARARPSSPDGPYGYEQRQRRAAAARPDSLLRWTDADDPAAQGVPGDRLGRLDDRPDALAARARAALPWRGNRLLCVHNLDAAGEAGAAEGRRRAAREPARRRGDRAGRAAAPLALDAYGYRWYRVDAPTRR